MSPGVLCTFMGHFVENRTGYSGFSALQTVSRRSVSTADSFLWRIPCASFPHKISDFAGTPIWRLAGETACSVQALQLLLPQGRHCVAGHPPRRHKLRIPRIALAGNACSLRCASFPHKISDFAGTPICDWRKRPSPQSRPSSSSCHSAATSSDGIRRVGTSSGSRASPWRAMLAPSAAPPFPTKSPILRGPLYATGGRDPLLSPGPPTPPATGPPPRQTASASRREATGPQSPPWDRPPGRSA